MGNLTHTCMDIPVKSVLHSHTPASKSLAVIWRVCKQKEDEISEECEWQKPLFCRGVGGLLDELVVRAVPFLHTCHILLHTQTCNMDEGEGLRRGLFTYLRSHI